jgi:hypothetical protein
VGLRGGGGEDGMGRYKDKYDESLNPFEKFKGRVRLLSFASSRLFLFCPLAVQIPAVLTALLFLSPLLITRSSRDA